MTEASPKISIIVPIYNVERYVRTCLDSICSQSCGDWECICIDDGSTDSCGPIVDEFVESDSRFKVEHRKNEGVSAARNRGLELARGEYIVFLDSDDALTPDFLALGLSAMLAHSDVDVWLTQRRYVDEYFNATEYQPPRIKVQCVEKPLLHFLRDYSRFYFFCVWGRFLRRSLIEKHKLRFVNIRITEDAVFMMEYFHCAGKVLVDDTVGVLHCERAGSACRVTTPHRVQDEIVAIESLTGFENGQYDLRRCAARKALGLVKGCFVLNDSRLWYELCDNDKFKSVVCRTIWYAPIPLNLVGLAILACPNFLLKRFRRKPRR